MITRLNISLPSETVVRIKKVAPKRGLSRFLAAAAEEKIEKMNAEEGLRKLEMLPPAFPEIKDSVKWINQLRKGDSDRLSRLGIR